MRIRFGSRSLSVLPCHAPGRRLAGLFVPWWQIVLVSVMLVFLLVVFRTPPCGLMGRDQKAGTDKRHKQSTGSTKSAELKGNGTGRFTRVATALSVQPSYKGRMWGPGRKKETWPLRDSAGTVTA